MIDKEWWRDKRCHFFDVSVEGLTGCSRTQTQTAVDFIASKVHHPAKVLDLCCGPGRYSVELAKAGFEVTGLDINPYFLDVAKGFSDKENVSVEYLLGDMREIPFKGYFDAAINVSTSFGFFEDGENQIVLDGVANCLKPGGHFFLEMSNRDWVVDNFQPKEWQRVDDQTIRFESRTFDLLNGRINVVQGLVGAKTETWGHSWRAYTLKELADMIGKAGFVVEEVFGGWDKREFGLGSPRLLLVAKVP